MMNSNDWDKCADVIHRLSSRVNNEQNQSAMADNCDTTIPLCIEKSFYQCKSDVGQGCCVEVCGNCSDPIKLSNNCITNTNINNWGKSICDTKINQQFSNPIGPYRDQFTSSKICDNKSEYIDYIVTSVLHQVVNHIPFDSLHQLSCSLPQNIENILCNTDIDSDRLIRILIAEALQCYSTHVRQSTDWYAFANLIKPLLPPSKVKDDDIEKGNETRNKMPSKSKKLSKDEMSSQHILNNRIKTTSATTPVSSMVKNEQSSFKVVSPSTDASTLSANRTPSTGVPSQIMSTTNSMTPMSINSKEEFTPIGTKYQSKTKQVDSTIVSDNTILLRPDQNFVFDKSNTIDDHESLPFRQKSTHRSSLDRSQPQHQISSDSHSHYDHKSNKSSDRSSSSDCVLTIHHKHKHKRVHNHHRRHNQHTPTSFDTPLSPHTSVPIKESVQKYKQTSADASSIITDEKSAHTTSRPSINFNSANTEQLKPFELLNDKQMLLFKLFASSDNATKHLHDTTLLSLNNEQQISNLMNEVEMPEDSIIDDHQLPSSKGPHKPNLSSNDNRVRIDANSIPLNKKTTRINHYPNMLADFD